MTRIADTDPADDGPLSEYPTQIQRSLDDYLDVSSDIGRAVGHHTRELFVAQDAAVTLQQQLDYHRPAYVVLHDIACHAATRLLHALAMAANCPVERLSLRRQGYGTTLAGIDYVDCPASHGRRVRIYCTDIDTDTPTRQALTQALLSRATLAVVMVGDLPTHALGEALQPLREALFSHAWRCGHLQVMPLAEHHHQALNGLVNAMSLGSGVVCRIAPLVSRPIEAWQYLSQAWNQVQSLLHPQGQGPLLSALATGREVLEPMPDNGAQTSQTGTGGLSLTPDTAPPTRAATPMERFVQEVHALPGVLSACLFDIATSKPLAHAGTAFMATDLARRGSLLLAAGSSSRRQLHILGPADEVLILGHHQALGVRTLQSQPSLALHAVFDPVATNWPQLRPQLMALDAALPRSPVL